MNKINLIIFLTLLTPLTILGQTATEIARIGIKSTVSIVALDKIAQPLGFGSGFILDDELIVTNVHVIEGSSSVYVLLDGQEKKYTVSGYVAIDKINDLVILKVSGLYGTKLSLGSETSPEIGEKIFAVGNPKGLNGTFSEGIISGIRDLTTNQILQITAPISPGSSGGPVLNSTGNVVGVAFASFSEGQNLNFAIPVKYLSSLKSKIGTITSLSTVKTQTKSTSTTTSVSPNIKEGLSIKYLQRCPNAVHPYGRICFVLKNDLPYKVNSVTILFLAYDKYGSVVDYTEETFFKCSSYYGANDKCGIKPFLAKTIDIDSDESTPELSLEYGATVKARILDFQIIEE